MPRQSISPSRRFRVLSRDNHTCQYCGAQPPDVVLVIDHIIPVAGGGESGDDNLLTSCRICNQGKAAKPLERIAPTPGSKARITKERRDLIKAASLAKDAARAMEDLQKAVVCLWCDIRDTKGIDIPTLRVMVHYAKHYGLTLVGEWIALAAMRLPEEAADASLGRYVSGIRRSLIKKGEIPE